MNKNFKLIGIGKTDIYSNDKNRMVNLEVASNKINNYILKPKEIFSFNKVLGNRTKENGYMLAESIDNGKIVKTIGGGICQISTTLNIAVNNAKLKVIERHIHSKAVEYALPKYEAAVAYNELDYKFQNTKEKNIKITSEISKNKMEVIVSIYEEI